MSEKCAVCGARFNPGWVDSTTGKRTAEPEPGVFYVCAVCGAPC